MNSPEVLEPLDPREQGLFDENFESAWAAVEAFREAHTIVEGVSGDELKAARKEFGIALSDLGYYSELDGRGNPLNAENITRRPGGEPDGRDVDKPAVQAGTKVDSPEDRMRADLRRIRKGERFTPSSKQRISPAAMAFEEHEGRRRKR